MQRVGALCKAWPRLILSAALGVTSRPRRPVVEPVWDPSWPALGLEAGGRGGQSGLSPLNVWQQRVGPQVQAGPVGLGRGGQRADVGLGDTGEREGFGRGVGAWEERGTPCGSSRGSVCLWTWSAGAGSDFHYEPKLSPRRARICGSSEPMFQMSCLNNKLLGYTITVGALEECKSLFSDLLCFHGSRNSLHTKSRWQTGFSCSLIRSGTSGPVLK